MNPDACETTDEHGTVQPVSRSFPIKLLEEAKIPSRKVGKHHRIRFEDITNYKRSID